MTQPDRVSLIASLRQRYGNEAVLTHPVRLAAASHDVYASGVAPIAILVPKDAADLGVAIAEITAHGLASTLR